MSDTLPEREDQTMEEENNECEIRRIRRARLGKAGIQFDRTLNEFREKYGVGADYCDECKGRPHAPWCSEYRAADEISDEEYRQAASEHEPAARGGGDEQWTCFRDNDGYYYIVRHGDIPVVIARTSNDYDAEQITSEHNQHQSLVAEREELRKVVHAAVHVVRSYQYGNSSPDLADEFVASAAKILNDTMPDNQQRSTSE